MDFELTSDTIIIEDEDGNIILTKRGATEGHQFLGPASAQAMAEAAFQDGYETGYETAMNEAAQRETEIPQAPLHDSEKECIICSICGEEVPRAGAGVDMSCCLERVHTECILGTCFRHALIIGDLPGARCLAAQQEMRLAPNLEAFKGEFVKQRLTGNARTSHAGRLELLRKCEHPRYAELSRLSADAVGVDAVHAVFRSLKMRDITSHGVTLNFLREKGISLYDFVHTFRPTPEDFSREGLNIDASHLSSLASDVDAFVMVGFTAEWFIVKAMKLEHLYTNKVPAVVLLMLGFTFAHLLCMGLTKNEVSKFGYPLGDWTSMIGFDVASARLLAISESDFERGGALCEWKPAELLAALKVETSKRETIIKPSKK